MAGGTAPWATALSPMIPASNEDENEDEIEDEIEDEMDVDG